MTHPQLPGILLLWAIIIVQFWPAPFARAQMGGMHHEMSQDSSMAMPMEGMPMAMLGMVLLTEPMQRDGSGTSWLPDNSPMHALHGMLGKQSFLLESTLGPGLQSLFGRFEAIQKSSAELDLAGDPERLFTIVALTVGTARTLMAAGLANLSLGIQGTFYGVDESLQSFYGKAPVSLELFLSLSPVTMHMAGPMHHMQK